VVVLSGKESLGFEFSDVVVRGGEFLAQIFQ
jgi:hypothetical protein